MSDGTRPGCYSIPSEYIAALWWVRATQRDWRAFWAQLITTWRQT